MASSPGVSEQRWSRGLNRGAQTANPQGPGLDAGPMTPVGGRRPDWRVLARARGSGLHMCTEDCLETRHLYPGHGLGSSGPAKRHFVLEHLHRQSVQEFLRSFSKSFNSKKNFFSSRGNHSDTKMGGLKPVKAP